MEEVGLDLGVCYDVAPLAWRKTWGPMSAMVRGENNCVVVDNDQRSRSRG